MERTILFHRRFPNKKISVTSLRRLYLANKVKRKAVRQFKEIPNHTIADFPANRKLILDAFHQAEKEGHETLYQDETGFSRASI
jgi:hypothetical protein